MPGPFASKDDKKLFAAARSAIGVDRLSWDMKAGECVAVLTSKTAQTVDLLLGRDLTISSLTVNGEPAKVEMMDVQKWGTKLPLADGKPVKISIQFVDGER